MTRRSLAFFCSEIAGKFLLLTFSIFVVGCGCVLILSVVQDVAIHNVPLFRYVLASATGTAVIGGAFLIVSFIAKP